MTPVMMCNTLPFKIVKKSMIRIWVDFIFSVFNLNNSQTLNQNTLYFTVFCNDKSENVVAVTLLYRNKYLQCD